MKVWWPGLIWWRAAGSRKIADIPRLCVTFVSFRKRSRPKKLSAQTRRKILNRAQQMESGDETATMSETVSIRWIKRSASGNKNSSAFGQNMTMLNRTGTATLTVSGVVGIIGFGFPRVLLGASKSRLVSSTPDTLITSSILFFR